MFNTGWKESKAFSLGGSSCFVMVKEGTDSNRGKRLRLEVDDVMFNVVRGLAPQLGSELAEKMWSRLSLKGREWQLRQSLMDMKGKETEVKRT